MNPLSDALKNRRKVELPKEEITGPGPQASEAAPMKVEDLLASLAPEQKAELFQALQMEMSEAEGQQPQGGETVPETQENPDALEDRQGSLKSTPGEQAELQQMGPQQDQPRGLAAKLKMQASKFTKRS